MHTSGSNRQDCNRPTTLCARDSERLLANRPSGANPSTSVAQPEDHHHVQLKHSITAAGTCAGNCCAECQVARTVSGDVTGKSEKGAQNI